MTTAIFPSLLHEDPRYYQMGKGSFAHRAYHGINRLFVTRTDSGHDRLNISESAGNAVAAAISNIYHPAEDRTASRNASTFAFLILYDGLSTKNSGQIFDEKLSTKTLRKNPRQRLHRKINFDPVPELAPPAALLQSLPAWDPKSRHLRETYRADLW